MYAANVEELLQEIESAFEIRLLWRDFPEGTRLSKLKAAVWAEMAHRTVTDVCLTAVVFFRMRRILTSRFGVDKRDIRPHMPVEVVLQPAQRRALWRCLRSEGNGLRLPELQLSQAWSVAVLGCVSTVSVALFATLTFLPAGIAGCLAFLTLMWSYVVVARWLQPVASDSPVFLFGDLAEQIAASNAGYLSRQLGAPTEREFEKLFLKLLGLDANALGDYDPRLSELLDAD